jgi:hypothetical protein
VNYWAGREVTLRLSSEGKSALEGIFGAKPDVLVEVQWADELGLWVLQPANDEAGTTVVLIKWSHFETAILDVVLEAPKPPNVIGFSTRRSSNRN